MSKRCLSPVADYYAQAPLLQFAMQVGPVSRNCVKKDIKRFGLSRVVTLVTTVVTE